MAVRSDKLNRRRLLQWGALTAVYGLPGRDEAAAVPAAGKARVLIVGGGFAGSACALHLRRLNPAIAVSLIDPDERYATGPMSNEVIAGLRDIDSITVARGGVRRAGVEVVPDRAVAIEVQRRRVRLGGGAVMAFDRLVVAPGIRFLADRLEGYGDAAAVSMPHAWQAGAQTQRLAAQLRAMQDGGVVAISVPSGLMRCPPAPYERASLIAHYLSRAKPRSKVLIFDSNNHFPRQDQFSAIWRELYPGMIEWIASTQDGAVVRVDAATMTLYTRGGPHVAAVANVIPPQAPGQLAPDAGLASAHGWCPIDALTFESRLQPNVHVIGDACIADAMPKAASAACSQARQCARAIVALLAGHEPPQPNLDSVCFSVLAPADALSMRARFHLHHGRIVPLQARAAAAAAPPAIVLRAQQAREAERWYRNIRAEAFGAALQRT